MAAEDTKTPRKDVFFVGDYTVNAKDVIGKGSYGIVYTATDSKGNKIAAKRIDVSDQRKAERIIKDLDKLPYLNHPNILKNFDIVQEENIIWIFMEHCPHGDLQKFFMSRNLTFMEMLHIMIQIAEGLEYLHKNNIIHRDIKPANILIADGDPFTVKLADFDLSKFLGDVYDTSEMSSNVGTAAFKAPEFYLRTEEKKIAYHRNVDTFATGLTFLAMTQRNKHLVPHLETAQDKSELRISIGSTIATRLRHGIEPLTVIAEDKSGHVKTHKLTELKKLIQKMTSVKPEERPSVTEVVKELKTIRKIKAVKLTKTNTWFSRFGQMCATRGDTLVIRYYKSLEVRNRTTGELIKEIKSECECVNCTLNEHTDGQSICCDTEGRIYVAEYYNKRLLVLSGVDGKVLKVFADKDLGVIQYVCWSTAYPQLTVHYDLRYISCFSVEEQP